MGPGRWPWGLGALLLLWGAAGGTAATPEVVAYHIFSEVFFCQPDSPFSSLTQTLDDNQLFGFDFPGDKWRSRLPDFQPEEKNRTSRNQILQLGTICKTALDFLTNFSDEYMHMPEAKGIPQLEVFTLRPLELGKPNTLVCSVSNLFPPSVSISWELDGDPVASQANTTQIFPLQGLDFQVFSYLDVTPKEGEVYSCTARTPRDKFTNVALWVPKDPIDPELLENILCGLAFGLGIIFTIVGALLIFHTLRSREAE